MGNLAANAAAGTTLTADIKHTSAGGNDVDARSSIGATPPYTFVAAAAVAKNETTNATNATTNATTNVTTNVTTTASLLINSAASVVSPGAVAFLLASLY